MDGKSWRMGRIFAQDGRAVILPIDHGISLGEVDGLKDPLNTLRKFLRLPLDGILMTYGLNAALDKDLLGRNAPARILTADTFYAEGGELHYEVLFEAETAVREGFDALKVILFWDQPPSPRAHVVRRISQLIVQAHQRGVPVMVEPTFFDMSCASPDKLADAVRVAFEIGADMLKVPYPGDFDVLAQWVRAYPVPVLLLGGSVKASKDAIVNLVSRALKAGISGIVMGRNVWNRPNFEGVELMKHLLDLVHGDNQCN
ncbi:MAG: hypothetical protein OWR62_16190 [Sulfobacillus thermotolerans]|nr:hypothetical protein [Sulfobacillus thermotolerans]